MQRDILWTSTRSDGFEHLRLIEGDFGIVADGWIVRRAWRARYRIECDAGWIVRRAIFESDAPRLELVHDGSGGWNDESLAGCQVIDIRASPFTNTPAIRALTLAPGAEIDVAFFDPETGTAHRTRQRYTCLSDALYLYEGLDTGFRSELPVDADGLLREYPAYFVRTW